MTDQPRTIEGGRTTAAAEPSSVVSLPTTRALLREAAEQARLAPSVHNTQPWRFGLHDGALEIYRDPARQLRVIDPDGRQLMISCGCAVFNARVALAAAGYEAVVSELGDPPRPDLVARITVGPPTDSWLPISALQPWISRRRSNRREYFGDQVPVEVSYALTQAAVAEGAELVELASLADRILVSQLTRHADSDQLLDPAYRAEIRAWTTDDPRRPDGVQAMSVPRVSGESSDELPVRDFDSRGMGWLPTRTRSAANQCLFLLGSAEDDPAGWLRTGQALQRLWLQATRQGYAISLFTQSVENPESRQRLRALLRLSGYPHLVLRVGHAPATPASRRRELAQLLVD
ncbi:MAG: Acg family FMN-binding oxidoreductase [Jatrophihabitantaceae bacterium]